MTSYNNSNPEIYKTPYLSFDLVEQSHPGSAEKCFSLDMDDTYYNYYHDLKQRKMQLTDIILEHRYEEDEVNVSMKMDIAEIKNQIGYFSASQISREGRQIDIEAYLTNRLNECHAVMTPPRVGEF